MSAVNWDSPGGTYTLGRIGNYVVSVILLFVSGGAYSRFVEEGVSKGLKAYNSKSYNHARLFFLGTLILGTILLSIAGAFYLSGRVSLFVSIIFLWAGFWTMISSLFIFRSMM